ncbi:MAG: hypothetical protein E6G68_08380 [Actinobacteria bacterium]|nr:MAG: hypothetical protein E6G68_08380 [Actinomycetota bacterium]
MANNQARREETAEELASAAEVVIDPRLAEIWQLLWGLVPEGEDAPVPLSADAFGGLLRLAYFQGYADACAEEVPGALFAELGVRGGPVSPR